MQIISSDSLKKIKFQKTKSRTILRMREEMGVIDKTRLQLMHWDKYKSGLLSLLCQQLRLTQTNILL